MKARFALFLGSMSLVLSAGCVTSGTHKAVVADLEKTRAQLNDEQTKGKALDEKLALTVGQNEILTTKISSMGQNVEQLLGEKDKLSQEHSNLAKEYEELKRVRALSEARNAEYRSLLEKLRHMIDAGTLQVVPRGGRLIVQMSSDVLFPAGAARIKPEARDAIRQLAETIRQFRDRKFQVMGHSDSTPIRTERFPSNWELSSQRAIEVVRLMVEAGVPPEMISASGAAEFDPVAPNDTKENKAMNRRVEVVFLPKIDELPGFDAVLPPKKD